jgi:hypothetical protein
LYQRFYYMTQLKWNFNGGNKIIRYAWSAKFMFIPK